MGARLAVNVVLRGPNDEPRALLAGDEVPDWASDLIGEHCLDGETAEVDDPDEGDSPEAGAEDAPPPKAGRGSSIEAWAAYAEAHGVTVDEDAKREDIIAACEAAGVPTE